jgi:hypothetical protein
MDTGWARPGAEPNVLRAIATSPEQKHGAA